LIKLGEKFLAQGDVGTARRLLERASRARDARATLMLGATYDPDGLRRMGVVGIQPDLAQAHFWYTRALEFGCREATLRLMALAQLNR
jgi:TPR repeat protein